MGVLYDFFGERGRLSQRKLD